MRGLRSSWLVAVFLVVVAVAPRVLPEFSITLANYIGLYALVALGLVLLTGVGGLTSFGQAAFVGLGAYATAVLSTSTACRRGSRGSARRRGSRCSPDSR